MAMQQMHDVATGADLPTGALATFVELARTGSMSAAAGALHLSQPAVSRRLQGLERRLGATLFDRLPTGLRPTEAGRALLPHAERALAAELDAVRAVHERVTRTAGTVTVAAVGSLVEPYLTAAFRSALERFPDVEIEVVTGTSMQVVEQVRRGEVAIGVSYARPDDPDLDVTVLDHERLVVVCSPDHALAGERLRADALRRHRWLVFPDPDTHPETSGTAARRALERHHVPPGRLRPIDSLSAQRALAMAGYGIALLPRGMVAHDLDSGALATITVPSVEVDAPITSVTRRRAHHTPAVAAVIELLGAVGEV